MVSYQGRLEHNSQIEPYQPLKFDLIPLPYFSPISIGQDESGIASDACSNEYNSIKIG